MRLDVECRWDRIGVGVVTVVGAVVAVFGGPDDSAVYG